MLTCTYMYLYSILILDAYTYYFKKCLPFSSLTGSGYIVVEPRFEYSLDKICCITHNTKLLGPLTEWKKRLKVSYEAAYNMIHFTPIQQLGNSKSAYAISDQLSICDLYLSTPKPQDETATYKSMQKV